MEAKETIEPQLLDEVAKALKVPVEAIKSFSEEAAINIILTRCAIKRQGHVLND